MHEAGSGRHRRNLDVFVIAMCSATHRSESIEGRDPERGGEVPIRPTTDLDRRDVGDHRARQRKQPCGGLG